MPPRDSSAGNAASPDAKPPRENQTQRGAPLRILFVGGAEELDSAAYFLRRSGHDVTLKRVSTPRAMSAALDQSTWDLVIAKYPIPHFNGFTALRLLREQGLTVPFILLSRAIGEDIAVAAMRAGANDYVRQGDTPELLASIKRVLAERAVRRAHECQAEGEQKRRCPYLGPQKSETSGASACNINALLNTIKNRTEMLRQQVEEDTPIRRQVNQISDAVNRALAAAQGFIVSDSRQMPDQGSTARECLQILSENSERKEKTA